MPTAVSTFEADVPQSIVRLMTCAIVSLMKAPPHDEVSEYALSHEQIDSIKATYALTLEARANGTIAFKVEHR